MIDYECVMYALSVFEENGKVMPINQKLYCPLNEEAKYKTEGLYVFYQTEINKKIAADSVLYVGVSSCVSKRFKEHKNTWLKKYLYKFPQFRLYWGFIACHKLSTLTLWDKPCRLRNMENLFWQHEKELGLKRLNQIMGMLKDE